MLDLEMYRAIVLGVVQGITEFLPISSDGHLVLGQALWATFFGASTVSTSEAESLEMVLALHVGTLLSIVLIYWRDLIQLPRQPRLCGLVVLATIPVVIVGLFFKDLIESTFNSPLMTGFGFLVTAAALFLGQRLEHSQLAADRLTPFQAVFIGCCQTLALLPGVSRSGSTIAAGLSSGLERSAAARFSFLMAVPAIGGATLLMVKDIVERGKTENSLSAMIVGAVTSAIVGYFALTWLLRMVVKGRLHWFAYYCTVLGIVTIIWAIVSPPSSPAAKVPDPVVTTAIPPA